MNCKNIAALLLQDLRVFPPGSCSKIAPFWKALFLTATALYLIIIRFSRRKT